MSGRFPACVEVAHAVEHLSNVCRWWHVDHGDDASHVTACSYDGRLLAASDAFASVALVVVARELGMARGSDGY